MEAAADEREEKSAIKAATKSANKEVEAISKKIDDKKNQEELEDMIKNQVLQVGPLILKSNDDSNAWSNAYIRRMFFSKYFPWR